MAKEWEPESVFEVLGSEAARRILVACAAEPRSAEALADRLDASLPTIYRRLEALEEFDLVVAETRIDPDGNHYRTFETAVDRLSIEIGDEGMAATVERERDVVDRFGEFWEDLDGLSRGGDR